MAHSSPFGKPRNYGLETEGSFEFYQKQMKLIIYPDVDIWNFVLSGLIGRSDVLLFPLNRNSNIMQKVIRKYGNDFPVPVSFVLNADLRHAILGLKSGDAVVIAEDGKYRYASLTPLMLVISFLVSLCSFCIFWRI